LLPRVAATRTGLLFLPKFGAVRLRHSRIAEGALKNVTLRQEGRRWFASLQTEREIENPLSVSLDAVGLDFGATTSIMPSAGEPIQLPNRIGRYERRIRRMQRLVSCKKKGGSNRRKAIARLAECYRRVSAIRRDFLHKETTKLANAHGLIALEDLDVKRMTASASGTVDAPGKSVRQKAGLNRAILRNGWSMARGMLEYKTAWRGSVLVAVSPAYTNQECNACEHVAAENRRTQALFSCIVCGHTEHADRNAAKNILRRAEEVLGGRPATTAGWAERYACEAGAARRPRPRSVAQGTPLAASSICCQQFRWQEPDRS
jgi:putative transposase